MNIQFQICGLSILFLLILFYKSHKTLQLYKERVFYAVLRIITVSLMGRCFISCCHKIQAKYAASSG